MSLAFSDTTTHKGIIQTIERELGFDPGTISGNTTKLKQFTAEINIALDTYTEIAITSSGAWNWDDSGHSDFPIIKTNLVDGQRSYIFTTDEQSNLILDIYKVMVLPSATATEYDEIFPLDQQQKRATDLDDDIAQEIATEGVPFRYDKTANGIFLDPIPSYNATNGLKIYINREPSYFVYTDTTKKPGVPGTHHEYFAIKVAQVHARRHGLATKNDLNAEVIKWEGNERSGITGRIAQYFSRREKDVDPIITPEREIYE